MTFELISILSVVHLVGAFIGVSYCTLAEITYIKAAEDGIINTHERKYLRRLFRGMHVAMPLVLCSGIALIILQYLVPDAPQNVLTAPFWATQAITVLIILFGYTLEKRQAPWWAASSSILMGWWILAAIDLGYLNAYGFIAIIMIYALLAFFCAGIVGYIRLWVWHPRMIRTDNPHDQ